MGNSNTPHSIKLRAETARRDAKAKISAGYKTVRLPPGTIAKIDSIKNGDSREAVIIKAVNNLPE